MTATNHKLTGMLIATQIGNPWIIAPLALFSHFAADALPHWGDDRYKLPQNKWEHYRIAVTDFLLGVLLIIYFSNFSNWIPLTIGAFFAFSPDIFWVTRTLIGREGPKWLARFHKKIQWGEFPGGFYLEVLYAVVQFSALYSIVR